MIKISIVNKASTFKEADLLPLCNALAIQVKRDFFPVWGINAQIFYTPAGQQPSADHWVMALLDNADQAGALGYHDVTPAGQPLGKIFVATTLADGGLVSVTASHEVCFDGDTQIPLLDGTTVAMRDLVGRDDFWVYSCKEDGSVRPGHGHSARLTGHKEVVKVTLDDGSSFKCTGDHRLMMRDGSYREAATLTAGDSMMPLYRRLEPIDPKNKKSKEYEQVYVPAADRWVFTHRMVVPYCSVGYVRHHADFDRFNNTPGNINVMAWRDHQQLHAAHITEHVRAFLSKGIKRKISPEGRAILAANGRAHLRAYNVSDKHKQDMVRYFTADNRRKHGGHLYRFATSPENIARISALLRTPEMREQARKNITAYNKSEAHRNLAVDLGRTAMAKLRDDPAFEAKRQEASRRATMALHSNPDFARARDERAMRTCHKRWHTARGISSPTCSLCVSAVNHKVVSVERCGTSDVYDLTVDKYHNFAIGPGVFAHNCEALADPTINISVEVDNARGIPSKFCAYEVGDPVESDADGYDVTIPAGWPGAGAVVRMSDFVTPNYFRPGSPGPYDFMNRLKVPLALSPGGYQSFLDLGNLAAGWQQNFARGTSVSARMAARPRPGSRRSRRALPRSEWQASTYEPGTDAIPVEGQ